MGAARRADSNEHDVVAFHQKPSGVGDSGDQVVLVGKRNIVDCSANPAPYVIVALQCDVEPVGGIRHEHLSQLSTIDKQVQIAVNRSTADSRMTGRNVRVNFIGSGVAQHFNSGKHQILLQRISGFHRIQSLIVLIIIKNILPLIKKKVNS